MFNKNKNKLKVKTIVVWFKKYGH